MAPWLQSVGNRLNLLVAAVCLVAIAGIWLASVQRIAFEREQAIAAAMNSNSNLAIAFEQQVYRTLKAAEQVATFVREQYLVQGAGMDLQQWVEHGIIREEMFTIISVVDEFGDIVHSSQSQARVNYADREFFVAQRNSARDSLYVNPPVIGRVSGVVRVPMSLRITRPDGGFGGVVVMSVDPGNFTDFYSRADLGGRGLLELAGLDGIIRGRKIGQESGYGQDAGKLTWFHRQSVAADGSFVDDGSRVDGVARIISYRSLAGYPLMVTVGTAYDDELAPVFQRRTYILIGASIITAVLLAFAVLFVLLMGRQRRAAEALLGSEALYRATFHQAATGIAHVAPDGRILRANEKFHDMLGYGPDELRERKLIELSDPACRECVEQFLARCLSADTPEASSEIEKPYVRKDGSLLWVCEALGVVRDLHGQPAYLVAVTQDITARKELEARLSHDATHDALTGLPNRIMFQDRFSQALESARRHGRLAAMLYLDLDGFKEVNDTHGHAIGDLLLQQVAQRLKLGMRAEDTVTRFGGDEFAIVLAAIGTPHDCGRVAAKLVEALSRPYRIDDLTVHISASVGAAVFPIDGEDVRRLVLHADAAMYAEKRGRKTMRPAAGDERAISLHEGPA